VKFYWKVSVGIFILKAFEDLQTRTQIMPILFICLLAAENWVPVIPETLGKYKKPH